MRIIIKDFDRTKLKTTKQLQATVNNFLNQKKIDKENILSVNINENICTLIVEDKNGNI